MRVVGGSSKGCQLAAVPGDSTRPILDRVKTALFDILRPQITDTVWLDLFAGSGSVGVEALSQGAKHCTFLDLEIKAVETIKKNLKATKLENRATVQYIDAFKFLRKSSHTFDVIYIAPPQYKSMWTEALHHIAERPHLVAKSGQIIVQIDPVEYEKVSLTGISEIQTRKYGKTLLIFFENQGISN